MACRLMPATRATIAAGRPAATSWLRPGNALSHSQPRKSSPETSSSKVFLPGGEKLLTPPPQQRLRGVVLAAELRDRLRTPQRREHELALLLGAELALLPSSLRQRTLLVA